MSNGNNYITNSTYNYVKENYGGFPSIYNAVRPSSACCQQCDNARQRYLAGVGQMNTDEYADWGNTDHDSITTDQRYTEKCGK